MVFPFHRVKEGTCFPYFKGLGYRYDTESGIVDSTVSAPADETAAVDG
jgi:hypothetical protein